MSAKGKIQHKHSRKGKINKHSYPYLDEQEKSVPVYGDAECFQEKDRYFHHRKMK